MAKPIANPRFLARDAAGSDLAGGYVLTYHAGTTEAKQVYVDAAETAMLSGPATGTNAGQTGFVLDSYGEATVYWATGKYKLRFHRADDTLVREIDDFDPGVVTNTVETENALANGSFEIVASGGGSPEGWELTSPGILPARDTADANHGEASLMFTSPGGTTSGGSALQQEYMPVTEGRPLDVLWQMQAEFANLRCVVQMHWYDATRTELGSSPGTAYDEAAGNPTTWTELHAQVVPPAGARFARLELRGADAYSGAPSGKVWFDGVLVRSAWRKEVASIISNTTLEVTDHGAVLADASGGGFTITLPDPAGHPGIRFAIVKADTAANTVVQVAPPASVTIDGGAANRQLILPSDSVTLVSDGVSDWRTVGTIAETPLPLGHISGLILANNATDPAKDIEFSAGECRDSANSWNLTLASTMVKQLDASWVAGSNAGGLFSGSVAADTWYHCFVIRKDSDGSVDCGFDTSVTAANIPAGYTAYRRIGSVKTDATPDIIAFHAYERAGGGVEFNWKTRVQDVNGAWSTAGSLRTLSVPTGVQVNALISAMAGNGAYNYYLITAPDETDSTPSASLYGLYTSPSNNAPIQDTLRRTNTLAQLRERGTVAASLIIHTRGWIDERR